jgi:hypothetical protein
MERRHYATSRKVAGSSPDKVIDFFFQPGTTRKKKVVGLEQGPPSLVSTTDELPDRKVAVPV